MSRGPATGRRMAASGRAGLVVLGGLLVLALAGAARAQDRVRVIEPAPDRIYDANDATVSIEAVVEQLDPSGTPPALTYEWQRCPDLPGAEEVSNPCDAPPGGPDQWALTGPRRFALVRTLPRSWFLRGGGDGRWRLRVRNADSGTLSAWRNIFVAEGVATIDDRPTMPEIGEAGEGPAGDGAGAGDSGTGGGRAAGDDLVVLLRPGVAGAPCGLGQYELRWNLVPTPVAGADGPPPSWTGTQDLPRRVACLADTATELTIGTTALPAGALWLRARHIWTGGSGLWSGWRRFRIAGEDGT